MASTARYHLLQSESSQRNINDKDDPSGVSYLNGKPKASKKEVYLIFNGIVVLLIILVGIFFLFSLVFGHSKKFQHMPSQKGKVLSSNLSSDRSLHEPILFPYTGYRLPNHLYPDYYTIHLRPNYDRLITNGDMAIAITCKVKTNFIILHKKEITVASISVGSIDNKNSSIKIIQTMENLLHDFYYIELDEYLWPHRQYIIYIRFVSHIRTELFTGFYRTQYTTATGITRYVYSTLLETTSARTVFPCFDEPAIKAVFSISITVPPGYSALSNTPYNLRKPLPNGDILFHFDRTPPMSSYLLAFVISDLRYLEGKTLDNIIVRTWATPANYQHTKYSLDIAIKIIQFYEKVYGIAYPLPKMDMIAVPQFPDGAMENWGLITYRESSFLYNDLTDTLKTKQVVTVTVAHELAHQWFGDLVTLRWWDEVWLNEGFASFMEFIGANIVVPEFEMMKQFLRINYVTAQKYDGLPTIHPIISKATSTNQIDALFDEISYQKASSIIRMLRGYMGIASFNRGIQRYLSVHRYKAATHQDLWRALEWATSSRINISAMMNTWTQQPGFPVLTVGHSHDSNSTVISQRRYLIGVDHHFKINNTSVNKYNWHIPITFRTENGRKGKFILSKQTDILHWKNFDGWVKLNLNQIGYYYVNYDLGIWDALVNQLMKNLSKLDDMDRHQLLYDSFELTKPKLLTATLFLNMTKYLVNERDYLPLYAAINALTQIEELIDSEEAKEKLKVHILRIIQPQIRILGWRYSTTVLQSKLQQLVLTTAINHNETSVISIALSAYDSWVNNRARLPIKFRHIILSTALRYRRSSAETLLLRKFFHAPSASLKRTYFRALATSRNPELLKRLLNMTLDLKVVNTDETIDFLQYLSVNPAGYILTWKFYKEHSEMIHKRYFFDTGTLAKLLNVMVRYFKTKDQYNEVKQFFRLPHHLGSAKSNIPIILSKIRARIQWRKWNKVQVEKWLNENVRK